VGDRGPFAPTSMASLKSRQTISQLIQKASSWVWQGRQEYGSTQWGWGVTKGSHTTVVTTAEAIFVLSRGPHGEEYDLSQCSDVFRKLIEKTERPDRVRYYAYGISGLLDLGVPENDPLIRKCIQRIAELQREDGAWSHDRDWPSSTFATTLALRAVRIDGIDADRLAVGLGWLVEAANRDGGWGKERGTPSTPAHTAHALNVLLTSPYRDHPTTRGGLLWLLARSRLWSTITREEIAGSPSWKHYSYGWIAEVLPLTVAFLEEMSLSSEGFIAEILRFVELFGDGSGGFRESESNAALTIPSTAAAVRALRAVERFLPQSEQSPPPRLTPREMQILTLYWENPHLTRREVSTALAMSESTLRNYINRINEKLRTRQILEAAIKAHRLNLLIDRA